jgi:hypothetical protein
LQQQARYASNGRDQEVLPLKISEQAKPNVPAVLGKPLADLDRHFKGRRKFGEAGGRQPQRQERNKQEPSESQSNPLRPPAR